MVFTCFKCCKKKICAYGSCGGKALKKCDYCAKCKCIFVGCTRCRINMHQYSNASKCYMHQ